MRTAHASPGIDAVKPRLEPLPDGGARAGVLLGALVLTLDFFTVLVALPSLQRDLGTSDAELQLVVAAYSTAFASGLIASGRLGDVYGNRRIYVAGLVLMILSTVAASLAQSTTAFLLIRFLQGLAAAMVQPQVLTIVGTRFAGHARRKAFAGYALSQALGGVAGQLLAGFMISLNVAGMGWRAAFLVLLPALVLALVLSLRLPAERVAEKRIRLDLAGMAMCSIALGWLAWAVTVCRVTRPWPEFVAHLAGSLALCALFVWHQHRLERQGLQPMLPLRLLQSARVRQGLVCVFVFYLGLMSFYWLLSVRLQREMGLDAWAAGQLFALYGGCFMVATAASPAFHRRWGARVLAWSAWLLALGHGLGIAATQAGTDLIPLAMALAVTGLGVGAVMSQLLAMATAGGAPEEAGALAGVVGTVQAAGNALGAALVPIAYLSASAGGPPGKMLEPYSLGLLLLLVLAMLLALISGRIRSPEAAADTVSGPS